MFLSKATYNKHICQKKDKQYIAVCTVRMFIEPSVVRLTPSLDTTKLARIRCYTMLSTIIFFVQGRTTHI